MADYAWSPLQHRSQTRWPERTRLRLEDTEISVVIHDCQSFTLHASFFHFQSNHAALYPQQNIYTFICTGAKWVFNPHTVGYLPNNEGNSKDGNQCFTPLQLQQAADKQFSSFNCRTDIYFWSLLKGWSFVASDYGKVCGEIQNSSNNLVYFYASAVIQDVVMMADSLLTCWQFFNAK